MIKRDKYLIIFFILAIGIVSVLFSIANAMYKAENPDPYIPTWEEVQSMPEPYKTQYLDAYESVIESRESLIDERVKAGLSEEEAERLKEELPEKVKKEMFN